MLGVKDVTASDTPPLVLVHGLLDTPRVFNGLRDHLDGRRHGLISPALPMRLGRTPVMQAAELLADSINSSVGPHQTVDMLGFSMGGIIARCWIQLLGGAQRIRRFVSIGSPHQGTITAQPWPGRVFQGIDDVKWGSALLRRLDQDIEPLKRIDCHSFFSALDLVVLPGWRAVLPVGQRTMLPVLTHPQLLRDRAALRPLARELLRP